MIPTILLLLIVAKIVAKEIVGVVPHLVLGTVASGEKDVVEIRYLACELNSVELLKKIDVVPVIEKLKGYRRYRSR
jgi:hypothetical protein